MDSSQSKLHGNQCGKRVFALYDSIRSHHYVVGSCYNKEHIVQIKSQKKGNKKQTPSIRTSTIENIENIKKD